MIYPISVLENKLAEIGKEVNRIQKLFNQQNLGREMKITVRLLKKKQKDLYDAIEILNKESSVDELNTNIEDGVKKKD